MQRFKKSLVFVGIAIVALLVGRLSFTLWQIEHPNAPAWIFFISNK
jgi:hypothetical protein